MRYAAWRAAYRTVGRLSDGVGIGMRHGFDSAAFMAHVYANRPSGRLGLGRALDRRLLDGATCTAFREVASLATATLREVLREPPAPGAGIVDLAAGPAPYLIDALADAGATGARVLLRDVDRSALEKARRAAEARGLTGVRTEVADAFDRRALASLAGRADVVVALGLYGMYPDDAVAGHLRDLADLAGPRVLVCNVQERNPQIAHIANVWPSRGGGRCDWRLRPLGRIRGWAEAAGFRLRRATRDARGIYAVAVFDRDARRA